MARTLEQELRRRCRGFPLHSQIGRADPILCARIYWPIGAVAWYIAGYDSRSYVAFGLITGIGDDRWGYFTILSVVETLIAGVPPVLDKDFKPEFASRLGLPTQAAASIEPSQDA
ncbi:MAG: hypothetical protein JWQ07_130 [Ramlibacter sp.]|nr:hypothetical protein [Ramlibacter sp.]